MKDQLNNFVSKNQEIGALISSLQPELFTKLLTVCRLHYTERGQFCDVPPITHSNFLVCQGEVTVLTKQPIKTLQGKEGKKVLVDSNSVFNVDPTPISQTTSLLAPPGTPTIASTPLKAYLSISIAWLLLKHLTGEKEKTNKLKLVESFTKFVSPEFLAKMCKASQFSRVLTGQVICCSPDSPVFFYSSRPSAIVSISSADMVAIVYGFQLEQDRRLRKFIHRFALLEKVSTYNNLDRFRDMFEETTRSYKQYLYKAEDDFKGIFILTDGEIVLERSEIHRETEIDEENLLVRKEPYEDFVKDPVSTTVVGYPKSTTETVRLIISPVSMVGDDCLYNGNGIHRESCFVSTSSSFLFVNKQNLEYITGFFYGCHKAGKKDWTEREKQWEKRKYEIRELESKIQGWRYDRNAAVDEKKIRRRTRVNKKLLLVNKQEEQEAAKAALKALDKAMKQKEISKPKIDPHSMHLVPSHHISKNLIKSQG